MLQDTISALTRDQLVACRDANTIFSGGSNPRGMARALVRTYDTWCNLKGSDYAATAPPARLILAQLFHLGGHGEGYYPMARDDMAFCEAAEEELKRRDAEKAPLTTENDDDVPELPGTIVFDIQVSVRDFITDVIGRPARPEDVGGLTFFEGLPLGPDDLDVVLEPGDMLVRHMDWPLKKPLPTVSGS